MPPDPGDRHDRTLDQIAIDLAVRLIFLGFLVYLGILLLRPFAAVLLWSTILAVAFYPVFDGLRRRFGGRAWLASGTLTVACLLVTLGPTAILISSLVFSLEHLGERLHAGGLRLPPPPALLHHLPVLGDVTPGWTALSNNLEGLATRYGADLLVAGEWLLSRMEGLAFSLASILVGVVVAGFLYAPGPLLKEAVGRFAARISGTHGSMFVDLTAATIRNVARGVIGVALIQSVLIGLALIVAQVPAAGLLALLTLVLCIVQVGALPVVIPLMIWAWFGMETLPALLFNPYLLAAALSDNLLKPLFMRKGLNVPILVILLGVIGGTIAFGLIGLFLGPVVLAVLYDLALFWLAEEEPEPPGGIE